MLLVAVTALVILKEADYAQSLGFFPDFGLHLRCTNDFSLGHIDRQGLRLVAVTSCCINIVSVSLSN